MKKQQHRYRLTISYWIYSDTDNGAKKQAKDIINAEEKKYDNNPKIVKLEKQDFGQTEKEAIL